MRVKTKDGRTFAGKNPKAVVRAMKRDQWHIEHVPKRDYIVEVADRVQEMTGTIIRLDPSEFLFDLQEAGLLEIEKNGDVC